ncbi:MAG: hypothetical protein ACREVY_17605 [Gammaproteobacteria bacterium]
MPTFASGCKHNAVGAIDMELNDSLSSLLQWIGDMRWVPLIIIAAGVGMVGMVISAPPIHRDSLLSLPSGDGPEQFHFRFVGPGWHDGALIRGKSVRLVFGDSSSGAQAFISFTGKHLTKLVSREEARLTIAIYPGKGLTSEVGKKTKGEATQVKIARFANFRLMAEVAFDLAVDLDCPDTATVAIDFFAEGTKFFIAPIPRRHDTHPIPERHGQSTGHRGLGDFRIGASGLANSHDNNKKPTHGKLLQEWKDMSIFNIRKGFAKGIMP